MKLITIFLILVSGSFSNADRMLTYMQPTHNDYIIANKPSVMGYTQSSILGQINQVILSTTIVPKGTNGPVGSPSNQEIETKLFISSGAGYTDPNLSAGGYHCRISSELANSKGMSPVEIFDKLAGNDRTYNSGYAIICDQAEFEEYAKDFELREVKESDFINGRTVLFNEFHYNNVFKP